MCLLSIPSRADEYIGRLQVEVDTPAPSHVVEGIQDLQSDLSHRLLGVSGLLSKVGHHVRAGQWVELQHEHGVSLKGVHQRYLKKW